MGRSYRPKFLLALKRAEVSLLRRIINKLTSVFLCVCNVIDHKFGHHIVKVDVDVDSRVDPQTTLKML